jgi:hypothetical protein
MEYSLYSILYTLYFILTLKLPFADAHQAGDDSSTPGGANSYSSSASPERLTRPLRGHFTALAKRKSQWSTHGPLTGRLNK